MKWVTILLEEGLIVQRESELRAKIIEKGGKISDPLPDYDEDEPIEKIAKKFSEAGFQVERK